MPNLSRSTHKGGLKLLYRTCGLHSRLPRALSVPVCYGQIGNSPRRGGYADVWKGEHLGQDVAVKVIRTYSSDVLGKIMHVSRWLRFTLGYSRPTIMFCIEILQGSYRVEIPSPPKCFALDRGDNLRQSVCNGVRLDD